MADFVFNVALGRVRTYFDNVDSNTPANSAIVAVLLKSTGLEADGTLRDYDTLSALLAAANDEADFTNYARKTLTDSDIGPFAQDDTNDRFDIDIADLTWTTAGGATNNTLGALLFCYEPDTTAPADANKIPVLKYDFVETTTGSDIVAQVHANGLVRVTSP
jgi:hypothetical protein